MSKVIFDPICGQLEVFFNSNSRQILSNREIEMQRIFFPIQMLFGKQLTVRKAYPALQKAFSVAEVRLAELCRNLSLDDLMAILRRAPVHVMGSNNWLAYLSLGLVKYTNPALQTTETVFSSERQHSLAHIWSSDLLFDADRVATCARAMENIGGTMRLVGKGAKFSPTAINPLRCEEETEVRAAVDAYEARRPINPLRQLGIMESSSRDEPSMLIFCLGSWGKQTILSEPKRALNLFVNFAPSYIEWNPLFHILEKYREPIMDLHGVRLEAIAQFLIGLSVRVSQTLICPESVVESATKGSFTFNLPPDDGSDDYAYRLGFTFRLLRTGYVRFPREYWIDTLGAISSPWAETEASQRDLVEEFLAAFTVLPDRREKIDISLLRPYPLVCQGPSGHVYVDFHGALDFIRDLVEAGKRWYSSQHGDQFTLSLKRRIESEAPEARVVGWKRKVRNGKGGKTECDLLVKARRRLYVIECKACAHSDRFFRGDPDAVRKLGSQLDKDIKQAKKAADAVKHESTLSDSDLDQSLDVQFCVCTPSQQYIRPLGKYGWLHNGVPLICTPEELISVLCASS